MMKNMPHAEEAAIEQWPEMPPVNVQIDVDLDDQLSAQIARMPFRDGKYDDALNAS